MKVYLNDAESINFGESLRQNQETKKCFPVISPVHQFLSFHHFCVREFRLNN